MHRWPVFAVFNLLLLSSRAFGEELELKVEFPRQAYVLGDAVEFKIAYRNTTQRTLTILPNMYAYKAQLLRCQRVSDGKLAKVIRFVELSIDFQALSRESVQLGPSQTYEWSLSAKLSSSLPRFMHSNRRGVYLVFPGSALELPGPGEYRVITQYTSDPENPVNNFLPGPKLWVGTAESAPVRLDFKSR